MQTILILQFRVNLTPFYHVSVKKYMKKTKKAHLAAISIDLFEMVGYPKTICKNVNRFNPNRI